MFKLTRRGFIAAGAGALAAPYVSASAQLLSKPVRIIVPYPAGGQTDIIARSFADVLARELGQPVIVDNKGGAAGVIGVTEAKRAPADGSTMLCTISSSLIQNRFTMKEVAYDAETDFVYPTALNVIGFPLVASATTKASSLSEFIDYAQKTEKLNFGAYGIGSFPHLLAEVLIRQYNLKAETVHYRGEAPMWTDLAGQTIHAASGSYGAALPALETGRGKIIGVIGERLPPRPDVPTLVEQGASGNFYDVRSFTAFALPAKTSPELVQKYSEILVKAQSDAKVKQVLATFFLDAPTGFEKAQARVRSDTKIIQGLLAELNIKAE
jgi:tripartite-type tricarboxylate transporter receptor subunit TctC